MAIKINGKDLSKRIINWHEVEKVIRNGVQIRPESTPPTPVSNAGVYWSQSLWLISLSSDWINWMTIADKNLWATEVYTYPSTAANSWYLFQRWNNYWFPYDWTFPPHTNYNKVDASTYWPWNYYSSDIYITPRSSDWRDWDSSWNANLRWATTGTNIAMRWPCSEWFHVPTVSEFNSIFTPFWADYFKIPEYSPYRAYTWRLTWPWIQGSYFWTSEKWQFMFKYSGNAEWTTDSDGTSKGYYIRPVKNTPVIPDLTRTVLYQPNS